MRKSIQAGALASAPIVIGYFPIAMAFGLLAKNTGVSIQDTGFFSLIVYAGASQFMALDLISAGIHTGSIILATLLLNLRHMMMSAALAVKLEGISRKYLPIVAFGVTDETFSVASFQKEALDLPFMLTLNFLAYASWFVGTVFGYLVGEILPTSLQSSLGIGLYAMFASLLFPNFRGSRNVAAIALLTAALYAGLFYSKLLPAGWDIIAGIVGASALGAFFFKDEEVER